MLATGTDDSTISLHHVTETETTLLTVLTGFWFITVVISICELKRTFLLFVQYTTKEKIIKHYRNFVRKK